VPESSPEGVNKKKKKRRPDAEQSVFESQPAVSSADAAHKADAGASRTAKAQALIGAVLEEPTPTVFETTPTATSADAVAGTWSSKAEEAAALITLATEEDEQDGRSVFQSLPAQTSADTGHSTGGSVNCDVPDPDGVFESRPSPSDADVAHSKAAGNHAREAEALIFAAAELGCEDAAGGVFERQPSQSAADIRHGDSNSGHAAQAEAIILAATDEDNTRSVFESNPKPSQAHVGHGMAAQKVLCNAGTDGVFESTPIKRTADAQHGETEVWGSEYETDESEAEVELPPATLHTS